MRLFLILALLPFLHGCSLFGIRTVELLEYDVLKEDGSFTLRQYSDYWVARTESEGEYKESSNTSFKLLFKYISGQNNRDEKISMTGPVIQQDKGEKIAMTGPVIQQKKNNLWTMEFVLPAKYNTTEPPRPLNPKVEVVKVPGYTAAALRFGGTLSNDSFTEKSNELLDIVIKSGLEFVGTPFSAGYDPPWTIPFLKRNEVLVIIRR